MIQPLPSTRNLGAIRAYYFLWLGAGGFLFPFLSIFYQQQGLSGAQIGLLGTTANLVGLLAAPLWGRLGDTASRPRRLLQTNLLGTALIMLLLSQQTFFAWIALVIACNSLISSALEPLSNIQALAITRGEKSGFGSVRLWGSLGWAITSPISGWIIENLGLTSMFAGYAISMSAGALVLQLIDRGRARRIEPVQPMIPRLPVRTVLAGLGRDSSMVGLALALAVMWLAVQGRYQFESLYLKDLGASEGLIGMTNTLALLEIPAMLWADRLLRRLGPARTLRLSFIFQTLTFGLVVIHPSIESIIIFKAITAASFSLYTIASIAYASGGAPAGQAGTVMALYFITLRAIINLLASPLAGLIYDWRGGYPLYVIAMGGAFLAGVILTLSQKRINH
ncbi:MAG: MFS transporter [Anaerolineales bacterium]|nr:MFS transporter [Anaerolineales bacterium]